MGGVGLGKTHFALALAHCACLNNVPTLLQGVEIVNALQPRSGQRACPRALKAYVGATALVIDELGYLPWTSEADLLFQVISARYERSAIILATNMAYKH